MPPFATKMRWLRVNVLLFASALISAYLDDTVVGSASGEHAKALRGTLSPTAQVYFPNSTEFDTLTARWSTLAEPKVNVAIVPSTEDDVVKIVSFALGFISSVSVSSRISEPSPLLRQ